MTRVFLLLTSINKKSVTCAQKPIILWNGIKVVRADKGHLMVTFLCHLIYALFSSHQIKYQKLLHFMFFFLFWQLILLLQPCLQKEATRACLTTYNVENVVRPANESQDCFTSKLSKLFWIQYCHFNKLSINGFDH